MASRASLPQWRRVITPIALAIVSLVAAVALWVAVTQEENPNKIDFFNGAIKVEAVNIPEGLAVASITEPGGTSAALASIEVSAPEDAFSHLTTEDFRAEVDLSGVRQNESQNRVFARYVGNADVQIVSVTPPIVAVSLEPVTSKIVPVAASVAGATPQGYRLGTIESDPTSVTITGAESKVRLVTVANADVNLTGLRATISQQFPLVARDSRGADVDGVQIDPDRASLTVGIIQQEVTLALTVLPTVEGSVAEGYNLESITVDPAAISVSGALEVLQALAYIPTDPVDVSGLRADTTRNVLLRLPAGLRSPRDSVAVQLRVVPAKGEVTLAVAPKIVGLREGLTATLQTETVMLVLGGDLPTLTALSPNDVAVAVDASNLDVGYHVLPARISTPAGVNIVSSTPSQIVLVLRE